MAQLQPLEGTSEELEQFLRNVSRKQRFRLIPLSTETNEASKQASGTGQMIRKGMFPELRDLTEEDFRSAEWYGDDTER